MRKFFATLLSIMILAAIMPTTTFAAAPSTVGAKVKLTGRIVLEVQSFGRAWYVYPKNNERYYIRAAADGQSTIHTLAQSVSTTSLKRISTTSAAASGPITLKKYQGYFVTADKKNYWYVSGADALRYPATTLSDIDALLAHHSLPVNDATLRAVTMNTTQITFDPTYAGAVYAKLDGNKIIDSSGGNVIRPIASLSKLMVALVLLDPKLSSLDWNQPVTIGQDVIDYPRELVGDASTSEVDLQVGDHVNVDDLWVSMLVASSNQSAVALAEATGLTRTQFVARMNAKAKELGLTRTMFYDIAGLDSHNVSTPKEMALIANAAFSIPKITDATQVLNRTFSVATASGGVRSVTVADRNFSLRAFGVDAVKVGYLTEAGSNAVIKRNGAIIVVLHASSLKQRNDIVKKLL